MATVSKHVRAWRRRRPGRRRSCRRARPSARRTARAASVTRTSSRARLRSGVWRHGADRSPSRGRRPAALRGDEPTCPHRSTSPLARATSRALARAVAGRPARVPRRPGRLAGAGRRDRRRWPATCERSNANLGGAFVTARGVDARGRRARVGRGRLHRLRSRTRSRSART